MRESAYKRYLLAVLLAILAFNYVDRLALGLMLQDLKADMHLSDTQLGLLTGFGFAVFYSFMGIPIARWADRGNRITIIALSTGIWCAMVALCGAAKSFTQLLLVRIGVAIGEAGAVPPAHSLIADHFTRAERPRAVAIYMLGGSFSTIIGYFGAGWLNELLGWRATFIIIGLPGLALAALAKLTLREPRLATAATADPRRHPVQQPALKEVCARLWGMRSFRHLLFAFCVLFFLNYGSSQWVPAFFIRSHGLQTGELGNWLTLIYGSSGLIGTYYGGALATRYAAGNERLQLRVLAMLLASLAFLRPAIYLIPSARWTLALMWPTTLAMYLGSGPLFAVVQTLVSDRMRAMAIATIYLFANLLGMGLGPLTVGVLSDLFREWVGTESLRYGLLALCPGYLWVSYHLLRASRTVMEDLQGPEGSQHRFCDAAYAAEGPQCSGTLRLRKSQIEN